MVSIPGGEPLMHPQIAEIVEGLVARKKYIYLCTNALLLKENRSVQAQQVSEFFVHVDGQKEHHDFACAAKVDTTIALDGNSRGD
jgi:MoaA/NifB/PqqE/SkfB family radical SAM enzyme